ncbi:peroxisomal membrane protein PEX16 [Flagelloscypha sp. PMI_526]|nr:peroxisomal membrane protein PEX16 [Flagelloscypha sp. PMI_526]
MSRQYLAFESSLRSLTWILPGRFHDAELASESLAAFLNVVSMYNDTLLSRAVQNDPTYKPLLPPSPHSRYTRAWTDRDLYYKWAARTLELLRFTQLLVEMGLRRTVSSKSRWRVIILLETIKASLRILLLRLSRRPLVSPPIPERDFDPATMPAPSTSSSPTLAPSSPSSSPPATPEHLKNNHIPLPPHPLLASPPVAKTSVIIDDYLLPKALQTSTIKPAMSLIRALSSPQDWLSEILYILRPLVYAVLFVRDRQKKTNRALTAILVLEVLSRNLRRSVPASSSLERAEYARRDREILWYLFRGNIWDTYTRPKLEGFAERWAQAPVLGMVGGFMRDWIPLIDEYYYYTAP